MESLIAVVSILAIMVVLFIAIFSLFSAPKWYHQSFAGVIDKLGCYGFFVNKAVEKAKFGQPRFYVFHFGKRITRDCYAHRSRSLYIMVFGVFPVLLRDVAKNLENRIYVFNTNHGITFFDNSNLSAVKKMYVQKHFSYVDKFLQRELLASTNKQVECPVDGDYIFIGSLKFDAVSLRDEMIISERYGEVDLYEKRLIVDKK